MTKLRQEKRTPAARRRLGFMVWKAGGLGIGLSILYAAFVTAPICYSVYGDWAADKTLTPAFLAFLSFPVSAFCVFLYLHGNRKFGVFGLRITFKILAIPVVLTLLSLLTWSQVRPFVWYAAWAFLPPVALSSFGIYRILLSEYCRQYRWFRRLFVHGGKNASRFAGLKQITEMEVR